VSTTAREMLCRPIVTSTGVKPPPSRRYTTRLPSLSKIAPRGMARTSSASSIRTTARTFCPGFIVSGSVRASASTTSKYFTGDW
jgi:hypothetical protein